MELGDLINKHYAIPETNTRRFAPLIINSRGQRLKKQPDYSINRRAGKTPATRLAVDAPTQEKPQA